jgi:hypothetical protein
MLLAYKVIALKSACGQVASFPFQNKITPKYKGGIAADAMNQWVRAPWPPAVIFFHEHGEKWSSVPESLFPSGFGVSSIR